MPSESAGVAGERAQHGQSRSTPSHVSVYRVWGLCTQLGLNREGEGTRPFWICMVTR